MSNYNLAFQYSLLLASRIKFIRSLAGVKFLNRKFSNNLIFILGCQRSGTTLMFLMMTSHPKMTGLDEAYLQGYCPFWPYFAFNSLFKKKTVCKLPAFTTQIDFLNDYFSNAKIVWVVRNPYSVVSSMKTLFFKPGRNWIQQCGPAEVIRICSTFPELKRDNFKFMDQITLAAHIWKYKNMMLDKCREIGMKPLVVKYEDLLNQPREVMSQILNYIEIKWSDHVLKHEKYHQNKVYTGNTKGDTPIDKSRMSPELNLTNVEKVLITCVCRKIMERFEYVPFEQNQDVFSKD